MKTKFEEEGEEDMDDEIDLEEILKEMGYGNVDESEEVSEDEEVEEDENELEEAKAELEEAMSYNQIIKIYNQRSKFIKR